MSRVFLATETRFKRQVVLKVLAPELAEELSAERFEREIRVSAGLQDAHIVPVLSAGITEDGLPWFTMPFVRGESLRQRLTLGPLSVAESVGILRNVAQALTAAHAQGVVHRDIKPDNVLLSGDTAVVTDFGVAKAIGESSTRLRETHASAASGTLTGVGMSIGTPAYMAPEQATGDAVDGRADIYAWGVMAYEVLAGRHPFEGKTSAQQFIAAHVAETPVALGELLPRVAPDRDLGALVALVTRCLDKDPTRRPQSAAELLATLDAASASAISAHSPVTLGRGLALMAGSIIAAGILAKAAVVGIGLPEWVILGAMLALSPMLVATFVAWHRGATWRRPLEAGAFGAGALIACVATFMALRAFGIGPAGSLLVAGRLSERAPLVVADFAAPNADSALGLVVSDAVRAALAQSSAVTLVPPARVAAVLRRMERSPTSRLDLAAAREVAQREGVRAVVNGAVTGVAGGYVITLQLVSADSGAVLASFQEAGDGPSGLIDAADKLARRLRGRVGESLRKVNATPSLAEVTTSSLEALRRYSAASRAATLDGDFFKAVRLAREAVTIDTGFAMGWRLLATQMRNAAMPQAGIDSAIARAYLRRDRLTDRERELATVGYYGGPGRDRAKVVATLTGMLEGGDSSVLVSLANHYAGQRDFHRAGALTRAAIPRDTTNAIPYVNLVRFLVDQGKIAEAAMLAADSRRRFPNNTTAAVFEIQVRYHQGRMANYEKAVDSIRNSGDDRIVDWGQSMGAAVALSHGRLNEWRRLSTEYAAQLARQGAAQPALVDSVEGLRTEIILRGPSPMLAARLDASLARHPLHAIAAVDRPYFQVAAAYAAAGRADRARAVLSQYDREVRDTLLRRERAPRLHGALAEIALAEHRPLDAIAEFRRADVAYDGHPATDCATCLPLDLGRAFDAASQPDSAIVAYERFISTPWFERAEGQDARYSPHVHRRLGELYDGRGDKERALSHYRQFVELWTGADPELLSQVEDVRRRIERLRARTG